MDNKTSQKTPDEMLEISSNLSTLLSTASLRAASIKDVKKLGYGYGVSWEITTDYFDRHNDYIQMYLVMEDDDAVLSDDSSTLVDLEHSGCEIQSDACQKLIDEILTKHKIELKNNSLTSTGMTADNFNAHYLRLLLAILEIDRVLYAIVEQPRRG
jgi:hypothetical protein